MKNKNVPMLIALSIPFVMVGLIALGVGLPRLFFHPTTSVLFSTDGNYWSGGAAVYLVKDGKLTKNEVVVSTPPAHYAYGATPARLWIYDPVKDSSREISFEEAQALRLDSGTRAPDGVEISQGTSDNGIGMLFLLGRGEWGALYLQGKGGASRRIKTIPEGGFAYQQRASFLGWVLEK